MTVGRKIANVRHVLEVVSPPVDMERLNALPAAAFGATSVKLRTSVTRSERPLGQPGPSHSTSFIQP